MDAFIRGITLVSQACGLFAAGLIAASVVIVCEMVFIRYVLNENTIWQTDFVTFSLVAATFIGAPYLLLSRGHVNVDVLPHYLGPQGRYRLALAAALMSLAFCLVMTTPWVDLSRQPEEPLARGRRFVQGLDNWP